MAEDNNGEHMQRPDVVPNHWQGSQLKQLCGRLLTSIHAVDSSASISSVSRWDEDDSTLVRVRSSTESLSVDVLQALRNAWPLATVALVENVVEGVNEAQVVVPSRKEAMHRAEAVVRQRGVVRFFHAMLRIGVLSTFMLFVISMTAHISRAE